MNGSSSKDSLSEKRSALKRLLAKDHKGPRIARASSSQQRLWFLDQLEGPGATYNMRFGLMLRGPLHLRILEQSLTGVIKRQDSLRTTFVIVDGKPMQCVTPVLEVDTPVVDLSILGPEARVLPNKLLEEGARKPFDLETGPLLRRLLIRLEPKRHIFLLVLHHIITDGWSMTVFVREILAMYHALLLGRRPSLPSLPLQYADYAEQEHRRLRGSRLKELVGYWRNHLADAPRLLELPTDYPRPKTQRFQGGKCDFSLGKTLSRQIIDFTRKARATPFMGLTAVFASLLARYSGQNDVVIGTPTANRRQEELRFLIGFFVNTLPLRVQFDRKLNFLELLQQVRETVRDAHRRQELPFEKLVWELQPERHADRHPLFQAMFVFQSFEDTPLEAPGLLINPLEITTGVAKFDIHLFLTETAEGLSGHLEYDLDLFKPETIERFSFHFRTLIERVIGEPEHPLAGHEILTEHERGLLLGTWNDTNREYAFGPCLHQLFEKQVSRTPDAIALAFEYRQLSFSCLNALANRLAFSLRASGVGPEKRAALCVERSPEMVFGVLGILKAGGAYVPLDPGYPRERLKTMLTDCGARVLLFLESTDDSLSDDFNFEKVIYLAEIPKGRDEPDNPITGVEALNLAYILYTSGSTGRPKGVMNTHLALSNRLWWGQETYPLTSHDRVLHKTPISFDVSVWELFWPLMTGARLVSAVAGGHRDSGYLSDLIQREHITILHFVPSMLQLFLEEPGIEACRSPRWVFLSGETVTAEIKNRFFKKMNAELLNLYGPTEAAIEVTFTRCSKDEDIIPIGKPIANTSAYVLDSYLKPVPLGLPGELCIGGRPPARGYHGRPDLTAEKFAPDPFTDGGRIYKTGDRARFLANGDIEFLGRMDFQVKLRGQRIEPGEIESVLRGCPGVQDAAVLVRDAGNTPYLAAYLLGGSIDSDEIRERLRTRLPHHMIPARFAVLNEWPLTPSGKLNRTALTRIELTRFSGSAKSMPPTTPDEKKLAEIWREALALDEVATNANFFDLGGHSLLLIRVRQKIREKFGRDLSITDLFTYPTIKDLAAYLGKNEPGIKARLARRPLTQRAESDAVAVIGMAGRFPGASDTETFWENLEKGVASIRFFDEETLRANGVEPEMLDHPDYVRAGAVLEDIEFFDAAFFKFTPREAEVTDPQRRILLECAYHALEDAAYSGDYPGRIGVFTGIGVNSYLLHNLYPRTELQKTVGRHALYLANNTDFTSTLISYKLNLQGPALTIGAACSTSLVAVHEACRHLLDGECETALAGGANVSVPHRAGYLYVKDGIHSPDGKCRAFDAEAGGAVFGNGAGMVVLKKLKDALKDGDRIRAVIRGSAINNDGSRKMGYSAPSVQGQTEVIAQALANARIPAKTVTYVETHGTGTALGDPVEVAALTEAFRGETEENGFCAIGSVKTNIGHLDSAAGIAGFIKTVLALERRVLPPSLNFNRPNPGIDFENSPFRVNTEARSWRPLNGTPRRAGVSSFGIGGTNAHVIVEEAPRREPSQYRREAHPILISARSETALAACAQRLAEHLTKNPDLDLGDVAFTLQTGREHFPHRYAFVSHNDEEALNFLSTPARRQTSTLKETGPVFFMFPGQGAQYPNMGRGLYRNEPVFRENIDRCAEILRPHLGLDIREKLYTEKHDPETDIDRTELAQPALFITVYAAAQTLMTWGVRPAAMIGHSLGEYAAACLAGVFSLEDALEIVAVRGKLIASLPAGAMLAVSLPETEIAPMLQDGLSIASVNGPSRCVVSGKTETVEAFTALLRDRNISYVALPTSHAFHSPMMDPVVDRFTEHMSRYDLKPPKHPFISNVTGTWITEARAADPAYWGAHLRQPVLFSRGLKNLFEEEPAVLLEVGPGQGLSGLARRHSARPETSITTHSMPGARDAKSDETTLMEAVTRMWLAGVALDWKSFHADEQPHRVSLPTYPFERKYYFMEAPGLEKSGKISGPTVGAASAPEKVTFDPERPVSQHVSDLWHQLLGIEVIGLHDDFFQLGGDSLLATRLLARLRERFQLDVSLEDFFAAPTIAALAERLDGKVTSLAAPTINPVPRDGPTPVSHAQRSLWLIDQFEGSGALYNIPTAQRFRGRLAVPELFRAMTRIAERHEALRTTFRDREGEPVQVVAPFSNQAIPVCDLSGLSRDDAVKNKELERLLDTRIREPFDLARGPLARAMLFRLAKDDHVLLVNMHHIISDGWSLGILVRELTTLYKAAIQGQTPSLPDLPIQYADYAVWQRQCFENADLERQYTYWENTLAGMPPLLDLPLDHPRPTERSYRGQILRRHLSRSKTDALKKLSATNHTTLYTTLLAAFKILLFRYSGQRDFAVGAPVANRNLPELENLIGLFLNTLAIRTPLSPDMGFNAFLAKVKQTVLEAFSNQDAPFENVVERIKPDRNLSYSPLYQVFFVLQNTPKESMRLPGVDISALEIHTGLSRFDLILSATETENGLTVLLEYSADLFEEDAIRQMSRRFELILDAVVRRPDRPIGSIPLLTTDERYWVVSGFNKPPRCDMVFPSILIKNQAQRTPQAEAVRLGDAHISYEHLIAATERLAGTLRDQGVGPGALVGVFTSRSIPMVVALLAILEAGGAFVPLDPESPQKRLAFMLEDARPSVVLVQKELLPRLPDSEATIIYMEDPGHDDLEETETANTPSRLLPEHPAYLIYTSGSTGLPKGVVVTQRGLSNYLSWSARTYTDADHGSLVHGPITFDATITSLFVPLCRGGALILIPENREIEVLAESLERMSSFGLIKVTPSHLVSLEPLLAGRDHSRSRGALVIGGEALFARHVAFWQKRFPGVVMFNEYGPTETVVGCCVHEIQNEPEADGPVPIGQPISNTTLYILDSYGEPCPRGIPGMLHIGGAGLARCYWRRPALTADKFRPHPFAHRHGERLYRSGDLTRLRADGTIEYIGRTDEQVKLRGFRIELGEIESLLLAHEKVRAAAVLLDRGRDDHPRLIAFVSPQPGQKTSSSALRDYLLGHLPDYMTPASIQLLETLPLTSSGKLDRRALAALAPDPRKQRNKYQAPRNRIETELAEIWAEILGLDRVSVTDNFFAVGGDSISGIQIVGKARERGIQFTPRNLFQHQTIAELANNLVVEKDRNAANLVRNKIPVTPEQYQILIGQDRGAAAFRAVLLNTPNLEPDILLRALDSLLERHDALRLVFNRDGADRLQAKTGDHSPGLRIEEMPENREILIQTLLSDPAWFDLEKGPLFDVTLFRGGPGGDLPVLRAHGLVADHLSLALMAEDLAFAYSRIRGEQPVTWPTKTGSFLNWAGNQFPENRNLVLEAAGPNGECEQETASLTQTLNRKMARALLYEANEAYNTRAEDLIAAALIRTLEQGLCFEFEERLSPLETDLSRTVGPLTRCYLVETEYAPQFPVETLKSFKEQRRHAVAKPDFRLAPEQEEKAFPGKIRLQAVHVPKPRLNQGWEVETYLPSPRETGLPRGTNLAVGIEPGDPPRLFWLYRPSTVSSETIQEISNKVLDKLHELIGDCIETWGYTPSDFPEAELDQYELDNLIAEID